MSATQPDIEQALIEFVRENVLAKGVEVKPDTILRDIGVDSYSVIEMVLFIERRYNILLPEKEMLPENLISIRALATCTAKLMS